MEKVVLNMSLKFLSRTECPSNYGENMNAVNTLIQ